MRKSIATIIRKLANWLDPQPTATVQGGGPVGTPPPPESSDQ